ncbi:toxin VasX [Marinobacter lutaoensis]|uniref:toxin VasX n=1 Tax=Marinobacter lutaoensis TaxID=135739 RepID=UPI0015937332|nr:toxin VasX [Marinobacter lutaoensis]NVD34297.1 hypothetical protein [Marinobacter lutaoensis]
MPETPTRPDTQGQPSPNTPAFKDEQLDHIVRRRAEYDDNHPQDLVLSVPKRAGGTLTIPLLKNARSNLERDEYQENTLVRIKPLAEIASNLPIQSGGVTINQGKGVGLIRPGYLYVFRGDRLWRELEVGESGRMSDVDLGQYRAGTEPPPASRPSEGEWLTDILVPVFLQGQAVIHDYRIAYSEVQWDWSYIQRLEQDRRARAARTTQLAPAWAVTIAGDLGFDTGFPAAPIERVAELRSRDLGVELMLETPSQFAPGFERPGDDELVVKLSRLLEQNETIDQTAFDLCCEPEPDQLASLRDHKGLVCVAVPDPLFKLRHSLAQLHLALHYLDALDASLQNNPLAHSAMLIRQAVFDPTPQGQSAALSQYARAIDRAKLDETLRTGERKQAIEIIDRHLRQIRYLIENQTLNHTLADYRECGDVAICEGYLLIADTLNLLQQLPGVLSAQGLRRKQAPLTTLKQWLLDGSFLTQWAPQTVDAEDATQASALARLQVLTQDQRDIDDALLERLNLQSLAYLEKQIREEQEKPIARLQGVASAGKVAGMISGALNEWSAAVLTVCKRLVEEGAIQPIEIQRIMQAAASNLVLADPTLKGIEVMDRTGAMHRGVIVGVHGHGLTRGLTDLDRTEGLLTRRNDYLYADLLDDTDRRVASTSPKRASDALEEAIRKVAGQTLVFSAPAGHPEVQKLSLLKVDFAKQAGQIVDGPAVARGLVVLAAFNVFLEAHALWSVRKSNQGNMPNAVLKLLAGAGSDLIAASLKLSEVLGRPTFANGSTSKAYRIATRPLFDMKNWFFIGNRLKKLKAATLVRTVGLATFAAGAIGAGLSYWDMRISLSNKDFDAATGHAIAMTGSLLVLSSPLIGPLLAIPGWGWAVLGLALAVGGGLYAGAARDDTLEQLLKRGPWGTHPDNDMPWLTPSAYYSQLLTLLSPIEVTAQRYADVEPDPSLAHPDHIPQADDYVITLKSPLISRIKLRGGDGKGPTQQPFRLVVQELAYQSATTTLSEPGSVTPPTTTWLAKTTPLTQVTGRQSLPQESAVRFLVKREIPNTEYRSLFFQTSVTTQVRVGLQATLDTELGPLVLPAPVHENYQPFDPARHSRPPEKQPSVAPDTHPESPYWYFTEVKA